MRKALKRWASPRRQLTPTDSQQDSSITDSAEGNLLTQSEALDTGHTPLSPESDESLAEIVDTGKSPTSRRLSAQNEVSLVGARGAPRSVQFCSNVFPPHHFSSTAQRQCRTPPYP